MARRSWRAAGGGRLYGQRAGDLSGGWRPGLDPARTLAVRYRRLPDTDAGWIISWHRQAGRTRVRDYSHDGRPHRRSGQATTSNRAGLVLGLVIVASTIGGAALGYAANLVPPFPAPTAIACTEYRAWLEAQPKPGSSNVSPELLAAATQDATGQLQIDLATLSGDIAAETAPGGTGGLVGAVAVLDDMQAVGAACRPVA